MSDKMEDSDSEESSSDYCDSVYNTADESDESSTEPDDEPTSSEEESDEEKSEGSDIETLSIPDTDNDSFLEFYPEEVTNEVPCSPTF